MVLGPWSVGGISLRPLYCRKVVKKHLVLAGDGDFSGAIGCVVDQGGVVTCPASQAIDVKHRLLYGCGGLLGNRFRCVEAKIITASICLLLCVC